jgi:glyoxylase-like metal-dependent hydrolase (beta-lactamase superfamily II)
MSANINVIAVGYSNPIEVNRSGASDNKYVKATGSCCLVRSGGCSVLFDTMGPWERDLLVSRLASLKIHISDINYLVCSHSHPDHIGNINLFTKAAKHYIGTSVYSQDIYDLNCFEPIGSYNYKTTRGVECVVPKYKEVKIDNNITIQPTPGHTMECISMVISNCEALGTVGLVGDLFEREEDVTNEGIWLEAGSQNADLQRANRADIYNKVDYLLPGHGPLFRTEIHHGKKF